MPTAILTGNKQITISDEKAEKILHWKDDPNMEKDKFVDLGQKNFVSLNQIKQILFNERDAEQMRFDEKHEKFAEMIRDWNEYVLTCKKEEPDKKAHRMTRSGCFLLYKARKNKNGIIKELYDELMMKLIPYFSENKSEWWAGKNEYQKLIPHSEPAIKSEATGWKSLGEIMEK